MAGNKIGNFFRRLFGGKDPKQETSVAATEDFVCRRGDDDYFYRYHSVGGILKPVDGYPYENYEVCMGITPAPPSDIA